MKNENAPGDRSGEVSQPTCQNATTWVIVKVGEIVYNLNLFSLGSAWNAAHYSLNIIHYQ